jgi:uncharacterized protein (DUF58 family)
MWYALLAPFFVTLVAASAFDDRQITAALSRIALVASSDSPVTLQPQSPRSSSAVFRPVVLLQSSQPKPKPQPQTQQVLRTEEEKPMKRTRTEKNGLCDLV